METYSLQFEIDASSAVTGSKQFEAALNAAGQAATAFDRKAATAFNNLKASSTGGFSQLIQNLNRLSTVRFNTSGINSLAQSIQNIKPSATAARLPATLNSIGAAASNMGNHVSRASTHMRGLENAFSASYQAGSVFRNLIGTITLGELGKSIFEAGNSIATFKAAIASATGSTAEASKELEYITTVADGLGAPLGKAVEEYGKFAASTRAAGVSAEATHGVFEGLAIAGTVLGLSAEAMGRNFNTATQVFSKGKLSMEELRQQFGDSLPGAFQKMENALKSRGIIKAGENLSTLVAQGKISSKALLLLSADLIKDYGEQLPEALKRPGAQLIILGNQVTKLFQIVSASGFATALASQFAAINRLISSNGAKEAATKIGQAVGQVINTIGEGIQLIVANASTVASIMKIVIGYFTVKTAFSIFSSMGGEIRSIISPLTSLIGLIRGLSGAVSISAIFTGLGSVGPIVLGIVSSFTLMKDAIIGSTIAARLYGAYLSSMSAITGVVLGIQRAFTSMRIAITLTSGASLAARASIFSMAGTAGLINTLSAGYTFLSTTIKSVAASTSLMSIGQTIWQGIVIASTAINTLFGASATIAAAGEVAVGVAATAASGPMAVFSAAISVATIALTGLGLVMAGAFATMAAGYAASADYAGMFDFISSDKYTMMEKFQAAWTVLKDKIVEASKPVMEFGKYILDMFGVPTVNLTSFGETFVTVFQHMGLKAAQVLDYIMVGIHDVTSSYDELNYALDPKNAFKVGNHYAAKMGIGIASTVMDDDVIAKANQLADDKYYEGRKKPEPYKPTFASDYSKSTGYVDPKMQGPQQPKNKSTSFAELTVSVANDNLKKKQEIESANKRLDDAKASREKEGLDLDRKILEAEAANGVRIAATAAKKDKAASDFKSLLSTLDPVRAASDKYRESIIALDSAVDAGKVTHDQYLSYLKQLDKTYADARKGASTLTQEMQNLRSTLDPLAKSQRDFKDAMDTLDFNRAALGEKVYLEYAQKLKELYPELITGTSRLSSEMVSLRESLDPAIKSQNDFDKAIRTLDMNKEKLGLEEYNRLLEITKERYAGAAEGANKFKDGVAAYFDSIGTFADRFAKVQEDFTSGFVDNFSNMISGAKADWAGLIDSMIKGLIKLMVQQAFKKLFGLTDGKDTGSGFFGEPQRRDTYMDKSERPTFDLNPAISALDENTRQLSILNEKTQAQTSYMQGNVDTANQNKSIKELNDLKSQRRELDYENQKANNPEKYDTSYLFNNKQSSVAQQAQKNLGGGNYSEGGNFTARGANRVDSRLRDILSKASSESGIKAEAFSGYRPGDPRFHGKGKATDVNLFDANGKKLPNYQSPATFRQYETYAQAAKKVQMRDYPELNDKFRWGGYFGGGKKKYGAMDQMHFDLGGSSKLGMAGGSFEGGLNAGQRSRIPGAQSIGMKTQIASLNTEYVASMKKTHVKIATNMQNDYREPTRKIGAQFGESLSGGSSALNQISNSTRNLNTHASSTKPKVDSLGQSINGLQPPIQKAKSSMASMGGQANGLGDILGNVLGQIGGSIGGGGGGIGNILGSIGGLFGFAEGGSMTVGGSGGADTKLAAFKVTPGERIDVKTPSQMRAEERARTSSGYLEGSSKENLTQGGNGVKIVNVMDPTLAVAAMSSGNGKKAIINAIKANPRAVRQVLRA
jgi:tape measure domain-containing protein